MRTELAVLNKRRSVCGVALVISLLGALVTTLPGVAAPNFTAEASVSAKAELFDQPDDNGDLPTSDFDESYIEEASAALSGPDRSAQGAGSQSTVLTVNDGKLRAVATRGRGYGSATGGSATTAARGRGGADLFLGFGVSRDSTLSISGTISSSSSAHEGACALTSLAVDGDDGTDDNIFVGDGELCDGYPASMPISHTVDLKAGHGYTISLHSGAGQSSASGIDAGTAEATWNLTISIGRTGAEEDPLECGDVLVKNTVVDRNLVCDGDGLVIGAPNITVDLDGHTIAGDGDEGDFGIDNSAGHDDVTVKSGLIRGFGTGIYVLQSEGVTLRRLLTTGNTNDGVFMSNALIATLKNNASNGNGADGFNLDCGDCEILNNTADSNASGDGMQIDGNSVYSTNNLIEDNLLTFNRTGLKITGSALNTVRRNVAGGNMNDGFFIDADDNTFKANEGVENEFEGFHVNNSFDNDFIENIASNNRRNGFRIAGGARNRFAKGANCGLDDIRPLDGCAKGENKARENRHQGFYLILTNDNVLKGNLAKKNQQGGFELASSTGNALGQNKAILNEGAVGGSDGNGILLGPFSTENLLKGNLAQQNRGVGLVLRNADDNHLINNGAVSNVGHGIEVEVGADRTELFNSVSRYNHRYGIFVSNASTYGTSNRASNNVEDDCYVVPGATVTCT
ncbi:MAG: right-handed parallel beta-helix repeat-containing protein [Actinomycetota bacterium]